MWVLTTRNRQAMCQDVLDAVREHGNATPGIVWCDGCAYPGLRLPDGWSKIEEPEHLNIGEIMRRMFAEHHDRPWYGWMADDCPPRSAGWDRKLVLSAGRWGVAYPDDAWQQGVKERDGSPHVTSIICMGGELIRAMGFWVLPGQVQMYIDDVWESVAVPLDLMRYCPEVKAEHRHFANGKREADATDARTFRGVNFPETDRAVYQAWLDGPAYPATLDRIRRLMAA